MLLGIFAKTFEGTSPHGVLQASRQAGYAAAQYNMSCSGLSSMPDEIAPNIIADIRSAMAQTGIAVPALSATYNMIHPSTKERAQGQKRLKVIMAAAAQLGIPIVTLCTGTRDPQDPWRNHPENASREAWHDLCKAMQQALVWAEEFNITLGIEPERANVVSSADKARQLLADMQSSHIKIILDPANLFEVEVLARQRAIITHAIGQLHGHISLAHAKDRTTGGHVTAAGTGVLDYPHFLKELRAAGFSGPLIAHGLSADQAPHVARHLSCLLAT